MTKRWRMGVEGKKGGRYRTTPETEEEEWSPKRSPKAKGLKWMEEECSEIEFQPCRRVPYLNPAVPLPTPPEDRRRNLEWHDGCWVPRHVVVRWEAEDNLAQEGRRGGATDSGFAAP